MKRDEVVVIFLTYHTMNCPNDVYCADFRSIMFRVLRIQKTLIASITKVETTVSQVHVRKMSTFLDSKGLIPDVPERRRFAKTRILFVVHFTVKRS